MVNSSEADINAKSGAGKKVSFYARKEGKEAVLEFVAEVYIGLEYGQKYDDNVMNIYKKVGGPDV